MRLATSWRCLKCLSKDWLKGVKELLVAGQDTTTYDRF